MKYFLCGLFLLTACQGYGGGIHAENDIFDPINKNRDEYFTHGTRFDLTKETSNEKQTYSLGSNIYTPSTKKPSADPQILARDRPYTGYTYGEYREIGRA